MQEIQDNILTQAVSGDKMAFRSIVLHYSKAVNRLAFRYSTNRACAEDITQDTFIKAFRALSRYQANAKFSTWLFRITSNTAIDYIRKSKRHNQTDSIDQSPAYTETSSENISHDVQLDMNRQIHSALLDLSDVERLAFTMKHQQGYSIAETAKKLKINDNACKQTIYRAVQKLRIKLTPMVST